MADMAKIASLVFKRNRPVIPKAAIQLKSKNAVMQYVLTNPDLKYINRFRINRARIRNLIIYDNPTMQIHYDLWECKPFINSKIPFSNIEHDTNRKFAEQVCIDLLFNFNNKKDYYVKLLQKPYDKRYIPAYAKYIDILNGKSDYTEEDIKVLISILGRLHQEKRMGPISVEFDLKLNPARIKTHTTTLSYINEALCVLTEYANIYLTNSTPLALITNANFEIIAQEALPNGNNPLMLISNKAAVTNNQRAKTSTNTIKGSVESPNYIEAFFRKLCALSRYSNVAPLIIDPDSIDDLINFSKRYRSNDKTHDFIVEGIVRNLIGIGNFGGLFRHTQQLYKNETKNSYTKQVAEYLISFENEQDFKKAFIRLFFIFSKHIFDERQRFNEHRASIKSDVANSNYSDCDIAISSDMHLNDLAFAYKSNFSNNYNIIAGDFYDSLYHRDYKEITDTLSISGIGVLGNHDLYIYKDCHADNKFNERSDYQKSITELNKVFPNIQILNDEVIYKNGIAFVGFTLVYDENDHTRTFFANEQFGRIFKNDNYLERAKQLLNQVDKDTPIVFISHSPFKEYAVCKNKEIGVVSDYIFRDYPNVKMYIHGHGHSISGAKVIENILCVSNPIMFNNLSLCSISWDNLFKQEKYLLN